MSVRLQGLTAGLVVGFGCYLFTYKDFWAQYEGVDREVRRFHYAINPTFKIDNPVAKQPSRDWLIAAPHDTEQSVGRRPADAWNGYVRTMYRLVAVNYLQPRAHQETSVPQQSSQ